MEEKIKVVIKGKASYEDNYCLNIETNMKSKNSEEFILLALIQQLVGFAFDNEMTQTELITIIKNAYKGEKEAHEFESNHKGE